MKRLVICALIASQIGLAAQPALAADLGDGSGTAATRQGAFAGARIRIPLGGEADGKVRAGLTVAPLVQRRGTDGTMRTRFGEGLELGFAGPEKPGLLIGGRRLSQLAPGQEGPQGRKMGVSTLGWVGIGVGVAVTLFALYGFCLSGEICDQTED